MEGYIGSKGGIIIYDVIPPKIINTDNGEIPLATIRGPARPATSGDGVVVFMIITLRFQNKEQTRHLHKDIPFVEKMRRLIKLFEEYHNN